MNKPLLKKNTSLNLLNLFQYKLSTNSGFFFTFIYIFNDFFIEKIRNIHVLLGLTNSLSNYFLFFLLLIYNF